MHEIRLAAEADIQYISALYDELCLYLSTHENYPRWFLGVYPTCEIAEEGFSLGSLYVVKTGGEVSGTVILNHYQPPAYGEAHWTVPAEGEEVLVIHTLAVSPRFMGMGIAREIMRFAENMAKRLGCKVIRLDTCECNLPALSLYKSLGYTSCGSCDLKHNAEIHKLYICLEKAL